MYWLVEYVYADRFESVINAESWQDAINKGFSEFESLSKHDQSRRSSVEVWEADRVYDEDLPDNICIPDEDTVKKIYTIK